MSVFLTPELEPFFGGTYFPPYGAYGRPGFAEVLRGLAQAWEKDRENVVRQGKRLAEAIAREGTARTAADLASDVLDRSFASLQQSYDPLWGGFGTAPKFPHAMDLRILLRHWQRTRNRTALEMAATTLDRMSQGGIYDQLGGGFHRYSTDERWLIPHFEKMLYDNALLVPAYVEGYLCTRQEHWARVARECCDWMLREMVTPSGGLSSTQDADSEGEEGRFFVWTRQELDAALGPRLGAWAGAWYGVTEDGNFEHGRNALWRPEPASKIAAELSVDVAELERAMTDARARLLAEREKRVRPATDDKVLAAWNGLAISALTQVHQVLGGAAYLDAARKAARFVLRGMRQPDGRLYATARDDRAHLNAYFDDYAFVIQGLIDLYETDFDATWLREALSLERVSAEQFEDVEAGGFFTVGRDHEQLIARLKNQHDGALPSGNGVHTLNLLRLAELTGRSELAGRAERTLRAFGSLVNRYPQAFSQLLIAVDFLQAGPREVVIAGHRDAPLVRSMLAELREQFLPQRIVALAEPGADPSLIPLLAGKEPGPSGARGFVCRNYACGRPADSLEELRSQLAEDRPA
jgi:uncharacterized protein YyaL (SSP411 family)